MKPTITACLIAAFVLHPVSAGAATVRVTLRGMVTSDQPRLRLADIASLHGDRNEIARLGAIAVALAPRVGQVRRLSQAELAALVRRAGVNADIEWDGAPHVQVTMATVMVDGADIGRAALSAIASSPGPVSRRFALAHPVPSVGVPARAYQLRARPLQDAIAGRNVVWIDVVVDGSVYRAVRVPVRIEDQRPVLVARRDMAAGDSVLPAGFEPAVRDVAGLSGEAYAPDALHGGGRLQKRMRAGEVLTHDSLLPAGEVLPGDRVRVIAHAQRVQLEMEGVAVQGGAPGQRVNVKVTHSDEALNGTLLPDAAVLVR